MAIFWKKHKSTSIDSGYTYRKENVLDYSSNVESKLINIDEKILIYIKNLQYVNQIQNRYIDSDDNDVRLVNDFTMLYRYERYFKDFADIINSDVCLVYKNIFDKYSIEIDMIQKTLNDINLDYANTTNTQYILDLLSVSENIIRELDCIANLSILEEKQRTTEILKTALEEKEKLLSNDLAEINLADVESKINFLESSLKSSTKVISQKYKDLYLVGLIRKKKHMLMEMNFSTELYELIKINGDFSDYFIRYFEWNEEIVKSNMQNAVNILDVVNYLERNKPNEINIKKLSDIHQKLIVSISKLKPNGIYIKGDFIRFISKELDCNLINHLDKYLKQNIGSEDLLYINEENFSSEMFETNTSDFVYTLTELLNEYQDFEIYHLNDMIFDFVSNIVSYENKISDNKNFKNNQADNIVFHNFFVLIELYDSLDNIYTKDNKLNLFYLYRYLHSVSYIMNTNSSLEYNMFENTEYANYSPDIVITIMEFLSIHVNTYSVFKRVVVSQFFKVIDLTSLNDIDRVRENVINLNLLLNSITVEDCYFKSKDLLDTITQQGNVNDLITYLVDVFKINLKINHLESCSVDDIVKNLLT